MQKIYTFILVLLAGLAAALPAQGVTIKYDIDDASRVNFAINSNPYEVQSGLNTFQVANYVTVEITAKRNCSLVSVTADFDDVPAIRDGRWFNIVRSDQDNVVVTVKTADLDLERNERFSITVNGDPEMIGAKFEGTNTPLFLREGQQTVAFSKELEPTLTLTSLSDKLPLYKVTLDDRELEGDWSYTVPLTDGCDIVVEQAFPDKDVTLTIEYTDGAEGCVDTFTLNNGDRRDLEGNKIVCRGGDNLIIYVKDSYKLLGVSVNGVEQTVSTQGTYFYYTVKDDATLLINARPYGDIMFTVDVDNPDAVSLYRGYINPAYKIELKAGENTVGVPELDPRLIFKANSGYYIASVNGDETADYTVATEVAVTEGMKFKFVTGEIARNRKMALYVDDASTAEYYFDVQNVFDDEFKFNNTGYTVIDFGKQDNPMEIAWAAPTMNGKLYLNDVEQTSPYAAHTYPLDLEDGDVVKVFLKSEPRRCKVKIYNTGVDEPIIAKDLIVPIPESLFEPTRGDKYFYEYEFECLEGTMITIDHPSDLNTHVFVGDEDNLTEVKRDSDRLWRVPVTDDTIISLASTAGVDGINTDNGLCDMTIYNLQGIAVGEDAETLPKGVYVRAGKKIIVK